MLFALLPSLALAALAVGGAAEDAACAAGGACEPPEESAGGDVLLQRAADAAQGEQARPRARKPPPEEVEKEERREMAFMDADRDGSLSLDEILTWARDGVAQGPAAEHAERGRFHKADADGNGKLDDAELKEFITMPWPGASGKAPADLAGDLGPKCDGRWVADKQCCTDNRPGGGLGPSPICRVLMNACVGPSGAEYECSWYNAWCQGLCECGGNWWCGYLPDYSNIKYCGYCGNPMPR